ncbi:ATP-dependent DNA helicase [Shewanella aquimarina]|uniref:ATP-dependent DNA helicase n=1 Tax=Shewanella aquimarina TaxID=260365 RepID=UPI002014C9AA|nr:ATP-dependent DNA helicase [Shewanella aquimarina]MCL2911098.1 ATP-dependent DNA helicase [Shewanella aquimarina]
MPGCHFKHQRLTISHSLNKRLTQDVQQVFAPDGSLSRHIKGYSCRVQQQTMATRVSETLQKGDNLVVEAGTGVGKTYAYLVPALLSGKQIIVSTGSKNLQEQLFFKDLPALLNILGIRPKVALLKGRSNYLCQHLMAKQLSGVEVTDGKILDDLLRIDQWASQTVDGDIGSLYAVPENSPAIPLVVSSKESCIGKACDHYEACFTRKARSKALDAKIIVVNHHLFFADRILKETGFAELLPDSDVVIFDEAHLLPDIAVTYFGQQLSFKSLVRLLERFNELYRTQMADSPQIGAMTARCHTQLLHWQGLLFASEERDWRRLLGDKALMEAAWSLVSELTAYRTMLLGYLGRNEAFDDGVEKFDALLSKLTVFIQCDNPDSAYSIEYGYQYLTLRIAPIKVAKECQSLFSPDVSWIFTSATLQINRDLSLFTKALGLDKTSANTNRGTNSSTHTTTHTTILDSPFDYARQSLFCVPRHLATVTSQERAARQLVEVAVKAINAAKGRTFMLFTSHRMLNLVAVMLQGRVDYPLLVQGQAGKQTLLKKYRQLGNAVLLGTGAFWEGVDVRGKLLSCVIIDKLPFVSPDDNLYKARADGVQREGKDPFMELSLPQAVISLNQGVGRLIRDEKDRGVLILCDNRIVNRPYGQAFINSLPHMHRTRDLYRAVSFLQQID